MTSQQAQNPAKTSFEDQIRQTAKANIRAAKDRAKVDKVLNSKWYMLALIIAALAMFGMNNPQKPHAPDLNTALGRHEFMQQMLANDTPEQKAQCAEDGCNDPTFVITTTRQ